MVLGLDQTEILMGSSEYFFVREDLFIQVCCCSLHNSQEMKTAKMPIS